ncbi:unnamed protein product [Schistosoma margrebowiei]|uniref:Uncharacterized protein n=1 Tax=Schistosoma margrebowiei TaxID=48269 RepID=A0A183MP71_9TREM|nr:unnamed protein product [Schistosoma margrebowiei]
MVLWCGSTFHEYENPRLNIIVIHYFSFKALNFSDKHSLCDLDSSNSSSFGANEHINSHLPERVGHTILSDDYQSVIPKTTIIPSVCKSSDLGEISPNVTNLLKPTKTRESEEVRVIKLYHIALRLCSSDCPDDECKARPVLESILNSFVIENNKLTPQLASVKFASCKLLGGIYFKLNKDAEGIDLLSKALQVDSNDLSLWIRLARAAIRSGFFEVAINSIDHILTKRPSHPLALQLALPLYFAVSELEICLELSVRMLQIDPFSEYAVYFINRILTIQPSLHEMIHDLFLQSWLHLIQETIAMYDRLNLESTGEVMDISEACPVEGSNPFIHEAKRNIGKFFGSQQDNILLDAHEIVTIPDDQERKDHVDEALSSELNEALLALSNSGNKLQLEQNYGSRDISRDSCVYSYPENNSSNRMNPDVPCDTQNH